MKNSNKIIAFLILNFLTVTNYFFSQKREEKSYLKQVGVDLTVDNSSKINFSLHKLIAFGAYHGSVKTEIAEVKLVNEALSKGLKYYFPEVDYSLAHFFQKYIETGDESLLLDLIKEYGNRVPQESALEMLEKWKELAPEFRSKNVKIVGVDEYYSLKYLIKHLDEIFGNETWEFRQELSEFRSLFLYDYKYSEEEKKHILRPRKEKFIVERFVNSLESKSNQLKLSDDSRFSLNMIITNLKYLLEKKKREEVMFLNFKTINKKKKLSESLSFVRMGVFHISKTWEGKNRTFVSKLIANNIYNKNEVYSVLGVLSKSKAMYFYILKSLNKEDVSVYTKIKNGKCKSQSFRFLTGNSFFNLLVFGKTIGTKKLVRTRASDITFFDLTKEESPFNKPGCHDFICYRKLFKGKTKLDESLKTTDTYNAVVLIRKSPGNTHIDCYQTKVK